jgi:hypothetical protein
MSRLVYSRIYYLVLERGAHYLITVKGNQPALQAQLKACFLRTVQSIGAGPCDCSGHIVCGFPLSVFVLIRGG